MYHGALQVEEILKGQETIAGFVEGQMVRSGAQWKLGVGDVVRMLWRQAALIQILYCSSLKALKRSFTAISPTLSAISSKISSSGCFHQEPGIHINSHQSETWNYPHHASRPH